MDITTDIYSAFTWFPALEKRLAQMARRTTSPGIGLEILALGSDCLVENHHHGRFRDPAQLVAHFVSAEQVESKTEVLQQSSTAATLLIVAALVMDCLAACFGLVTLKHLMAELAQEIRMRPSLELYHQLSGQCHSAPMSRWSPPGRPPEAARSAVRTVQTLHWPTLLSDRCLAD
jgi:hypothetical protein